MQGALVDGGREMWHSLAHHTIMFSLLADKLDNTFRKLRGLGKISEKNIADALPADAIQVRIERVDDMTRRITVEGVELP
mgnify:FL=1